jgi:hypothetical protein
MAEIKQNLRSLMYLKTPYQNSYLNHRQTVDVWKIIIVCQELVHNEY